MRAKWSAPIRKYWKISEQMMVKYCDLAICDSVNIHIYERDVFCPKKMDDGTFAVTDRSVTIHRFSGSWLTEREKKRGTNVLWRNVMRPILKKIRVAIIQVFGNQTAKRIEAAIRNLLR